MTSARWRRIAAGHYQHGPWTLRSWNENQWWLFEAGQLHGRWRRRGGLRVYRPFRTLRAAVAAPHVIHDLDHVPEL